MSAALLGVLLFLTATATASAARKPVAARAGGRPSPVPPLPAPAAAPPAARGASEPAPSSSASAAPAATAMAAAVQAAAVPADDADSSASPVWDRAAPRPSDAVHASAAVPKRDSGLSPRERAVASYRAESRPLGALPPRRPLTNYFLHWSKEQKDLRRLARAVFVEPTLAYWAAFSPKVQPWTALTPLGAIGESARKAAAVLAFLRRVESRPPEWTTPNRVALDQRAFRLLDFNEGAAVDRARTPAVIVPPNSGHLSTIADYDAGKSVVETFLKGGRPVYSLDWKSATSDFAQLIGDLAENVIDAIDKAGGTAQLVGLCQGGWLAMIVAALEPEKVEALYLAGSPIDATRGDNAVTRGAKLPMEVFNWMVHGIGKPNVYDGETQLEAFLSIGPMLGKAKRVDFWRDLYDNIDDPAYVAKAERFARWFFAVNDLSLWYLEAVEKLFKRNELYRGTLKIVYRGRVREVDLSKIRVPIVLMEGTKDDITPPAVVRKDDLNSVVSNADAAWDFLIARGFVADSGEEGVNRERGVQAVVEPRALAASKARFLQDAGPVLGARDARRLWEHLRSRRGQTLAARDVVSTPQDAVFSYLVNAGHIGLYNSRAAQDTWAAAHRAVSRLTDR